LLVATTRVRMTPRGRPVRTIPCFVTNRRLASRSAFRSLNSADSDAEVFIVRDWKSLCVYSSLPRILDVPGSKRDKRYGCGMQVTREAVNCAVTPPM